MTQGRVLSEEEIQEIGTEFVSDNVLNLVSTIRDRDDEIVYLKLSVGYWKSMNAGRKDLLNKAEAMITNRNKQIVELAKAAKAECPHCNDWYTDSEKTDCKVCAVLAKIRMEGETE